MAQVPDRIMTIARRFVDELENGNIHLKDALLFGSYAKGNARELSDIDIALVSDDFEGFRFRDKEKIRRSKLNVDCLIDPWPYRPEDFTEDDLFVKEILKTGVRIR